MLGPNRAAAPEQSVVDGYTAGSRCLPSLESVRSRGRAGGDDPHGDAARSSWVALNYEGPSGLLREEEPEACDADDLGQVDGAGVVVVRVERDRVLLG
jgi:hypothetical protein